MIKIFTGAFWIAEDAEFLYVDNADSENTARKRTCQKVPFLTVRLKQRTLLICVLFSQQFHLYSPIHSEIWFLYASLFLCVEVLRPSQPNGVMSSAVSLPNHTFTGQA